MAQPIPVSSPLLLDFYRAWLAWVESGAADGAPFCCHSGLCGSVMHFFEREGVIPRSHMHLWAATQAAMGAQFMEAGLSQHYPFGEGDFDQRLSDSTQHECPKRLAWVRARIADAEAAGVPTP